MERQSTLLEMKGICKEFAGVPALSGVDFSVREGEVHGLAGQNGAGKSTLIKILTGVYQRDNGSILLDGKSISPRSPSDAQRLGVSTIYQELSLVPNLSVAENISICREPHKMGRIDWKGARQRAERIMSELGVNANVLEPVSDQSVAVQQMIAIARAVSFDAKLIVMDEPTSSLEDSEVRILMDIIRKLKTQGVSIVFITHRLDEMFEICDRVTILRDGLLEGCYDASDLDKLKLILKMIGKNEAEFLEMSHLHDPAARTVSDGDYIVELENLTYSNRVNDVTFKMRRGEIFGVAGLLGAGKSEAAKSIFGAYPDYSGKVKFDGSVLEKKKPAVSIKRGMGFLSEDRKVEGILPRLSVRENISIVLLSRITKYGLVNRRKERKVVKEFVEKLGIKIASLDQEVRSLSGGNQQKVLLARWLCTQPQLLLLDEPTRGIDVGAKLDVQRLIQAMAKDGVSVMMINSELSELISACDRVAVMREGHLSGILEGGEITEDGITRLIAESSASSAK